MSVNKAWAETASWSSILWPGALMAILLGVLYSGTYADMVAIWSRSETFAHGFLILPISVYLVWRKRDILAKVSPRPDWRAVPFIGILGFVWLISSLAEVAVVSQFAAVAMIPALIFALTGWPVVRVILFPLGFLFFSVPVGEGLIHPLMELTASFTVFMIKLTGIPVYVEGTFFSIPSGDWSVVEGCSGIRYLIASITMGALYAYLNYATLKKRIIFVGFSVALPILANGLRAFTIVMIAHYSDMKLALGVDHLIYGWVFFGFVIMLMFWIGSYWRDSDELIEKTVSNQISDEGNKPIMANGNLYAITAFALAFSFAWPVLGMALEHRSDQLTGISLSPLNGRNGWVETNTVTDWIPRYIDMDAEQHKTFIKEDAVVGVYLAYYAGVSGEGELVNSQNVMVRQKHPVWQDVGSEHVELFGHSATRTKLRSVDQRLLAVHWYWINGVETSNPYWGKIIDAGYRLVGQPPLSIGVVVYTPYIEDEEEAELIIRAFMGDMNKVLHQSMNLTERGG